MKWWYVEERTPEPGVLYEDGHPSIFRRLTLYIAGALSIAMGAGYW